MDCSPLLSQNESCAQRVEAQHVLSVLAVFEILARLKIFEVCFFCEMVLIPENFSNLTRPKDSAQINVKMCTWLSLRDWKSN